MEVLLGILIAIVGISLIIALRLFTTLIHELGHAIPALWFTKKKVTVYIGSYGDISDTYKITIDRLTILFKWNFFDWKIGLCEQEESVSELWKNFIIILGGPIASLLIAIPLIIQWKSLQEHDFLFAMSIFFTSAAILDFIVNIFPTGRPIHLHNGNSTYNDGTSLVKLISRKWLPSEYLELEELFYDEKYGQVIENGNTLLASNKTFRPYYTLVLESLITLKENEKALMVYDELNEHLPLLDEDYYTIGKIHARLGQYQEALICFNKSYFIDFSNPELLNDMGRVKIELSKNESALKNLNSAIMLSSKLNWPFINRARAKINLGLYNEALQDLLFANKLDSNEPMTYYYLGDVYKKMNRDKEALEHFEKASMMNCDHHGLDFHLASLKNHKKY